MARQYKKGLELIHKETKKKLLFGAFSGDEATCLTKDNQFIKISRQELDSEYITPAEMEKRAREKRRGQAW